MHFNVFAEIELSFKSVEWHEKTEIVSDSLQLYLDSNDSSLPDDRQIAKPQVHFKAKVNKNRNTEPRDT